MRKLSFVVVLVFGFMICMQAAGADDRHRQTGGQALATAKLHPIDRSGIKGDLIFLDTGDDSPAPRLAVSGRATGLDPEDAYVSLLYDVRSRVSGPQACEPSPTSDLTDEEMFAGQWVVEPDGSGKLVLIKISLYVSIFRTGTVSIREVFEDGTSVVVACGNVSIINRSVER